MFISAEQSQDFTASCFFLQEFLKDKIVIKY